MRLTDFWERMNAHFGPGLVDAVARDHVIAALGGRTVLEAIEAGIETKEIWRVVCETFEVPYSLT